MGILVLGLGDANSGDASAGILAARYLRRELEDLADVSETTLRGAALLDLLLGYDRAILLDAALTGQVSPGTVSELDPRSLHAASAPSPRSAALPDLFSAAELLHLDFPQEVRLFTVEAHGPQAPGAAVSPAVAGALATLAERAAGQVRRWHHLGALAGSAM